PLPLPQKTARPIGEGMAEDVPESADELPSPVISTINVEPIPATALLSASEPEVTPNTESVGEASTPEASVPAGRRRRRRVTSSEQLSLDANA
ncbi:MAG: ribonuclease E/G, partial [Thermosynechococcus sp. Uc]|nr:ribonuclease E/G [Thermosynechococcus sp. Uc]